MSGEVDVEDLITAVRHWIGAEWTLGRAMEEYQGVSPGYHLSRENDAEVEARKHLKETIDSYIDQRIRRRT